MAGEETLHGNLRDVRKRLEALQRERRHQFNAAESALKGAEDRAQWLQLRARQENWAIYPQSEIEDTVRRGKELYHEHLGRARSLGEQMRVLATENGLTLPTAGTEKCLRVDCACCGFQGLKNAYRVGDVWIGPECASHFPPACRRHLKRYEAALSLSKAPPLGF